MDQAVSSFKDREIGHSPSIQQIKDYLSLFYNGTHCPCHLFQQDEPVLSHPSWSFFSHPLMEYRPIITDRDLKINYVSTEDFLLLGIVDYPEADLQVVLGPVSPLPLTETMIHRIHKRYQISDEHFVELQEYFIRTPLFSQLQFCSLLGMIYQFFYHTTLNILAQLTGNIPVKEQQVGQKHTKAMVERKENSRYHDTYYFEQEYYSFVEKGDVEGLMDYSKTMPSITEGMVAQDSLRQAKNIFIANITLITRHAISGGLDIETAYQLSDSYIQEAEYMNSATAIMALMYTAMLDYTKRVSDAKIPKGMSADIFKTLQYISNHINHPLSVEEIAGHLSMDRSTLSKKFKRELGFNISTFIMRRKLEEARSLLQYSDHTISEISEYLCFSSQSYFQNVFKGKYGITPKEYRKRSRED